MLRSILRSIDSARAYRHLPSRAREERRNDNLGLPALDPGIGPVIAESIAWLCNAQDNSASNDGGVSRDFSLIKGWNASYPETTGYIIPTILAFAKLTKDESLRQRAKRMLDWLVSIQFEDGGFPGSIVGAVPTVPVTFNTGQILLGLASGAAGFGDEYREPMRSAAEWLVQTQDPDGCWRKHASPFAQSSERTYDTHVAWALFEAARLEPHSRYAGAGLANVKWALSLQHNNGWFEDCCLTDNKRPLTHTIGYALRGVIEAYRFTKDQEFLHASRKSADGLLTALGKDGFIPGRFDSNWRGTVQWTCLTGSAQIAACWLLLYEHTNEAKYRDAARLANQYVRRTVKLEGPAEIRGAVKGSFPISGNYCAYEYPNWAAKFVIDSNILEQTILAEEPVDDDVL